ncbi:MAG: dTMP kinase [Anaerolineae bacterium]|nr:dTMP kinase [Anaerolineae bacterium]
MSRLIVFEGAEGSGKTTQLHLLRAYLEGRGLRVLATREPGGTPIGERIRAITNDPASESMQPRAELLLYLASRAQLVEQVIKPALAQGILVLCDRYAESSLAYQGYGRGLDLVALRQLNGFATGGLRADLVIYLDLPVEVGLRRKALAHAQGQDEWTRIDQEEIAFHRRVREGYLAMAAAEPQRWCVLDARQPVDDVQKAIRRRIEALLAEAGSQA